MKNSRRQFMILQALAVSHTKNCRIRVRYKVLLNRGKNA